MINCSCKTYVGTYPCPGCTTSLPDGQRVNIPAQASAEQVQTAWAVWAAVVLVAAPRGEGVEITIDEESGEVLVSTLCAPLWEATQIAVRKDGTWYWNSEQSAPEVPGLPVIDEANAS